MFKTLKAIFNTPTEAGKVADAVIKGADAAWFTKEEQSAWFLRYLEATLPMNVSRRIIAVTITAIWAISALTLLGLTLAGADVAQDVSAYMSTAVNAPFSIIVGFYFAKAVAQNWPK